VRQRAIELVFAAIDSSGERHGHVTRIARQLDIGPETPRHWVRQAEIDRGTKPGTTTGERERITELEKENRELRRVNQILKKASVFSPGSSIGPGDDPLHRGAARSFLCRAHVPHLGGHRRRPTTRRVR
jgi:transposase